ncbi:MAG: DUF4190 domain-containing protein [Acidobacteriota bacterium]
MPTSGGEGNGSSGGETQETTPKEQQPPSSPTVKTRAGRATAALVLGILGIVCCQLLGPIAWYIGDQELKDIRRGASPAKDEGVAKAGMILGIISTVLLALAILWIVFLGGLAFLGAILEGARG